MLMVDDVERSIRFYARLGFELIDREGDSWVRMHCEGGALMFMRATPTATDRRCVLFYMYSEDLAALRQELIVGGVNVPPIEYPEHMPSGEVTFEDPDGYAIGIGHWSDNEHQAWLKRLDEKGLRPRSA